MLLYAIKIKSWRNLTNMTIHVQEIELLLSRIKHDLDDNHTLYSSVLDYTVGYLTDMVSTYRSQNDDEERLDRYRIAAIPSVMTALVPFLPTTPCNMGDVADRVDSLARCLLFRAKAAQRNDSVSQPAPQSVQS